MNTNPATGGVMMPAVLAAIAGVLYVIFLFLALWLAPWWFIPAGLAVIYANAHTLVRQLRRHRLMITLTVAPDGQSIRDVRIPLGARPGSGTCELDTNAGRPGQ